MNPTEFEKLRAENERLEQGHEQSLHTAEGLSAYRNAKMQLLEEIMRLTANAAHTPESEAAARLGTAIACQAVSTEVIEETKTGYTKTALSLVSEEQRSRCTACYDALVAYIRETNRLYIADFIERTAPTRERRLALFRLYDQQHRRNTEAAQAQNKRINRLFGSRG